MEDISPTERLFNSILDNVETLPIVKTLSLKGIAPLDIYEHFFKDNRFAFLFDSGKGNRRTSRYSFIGSGGNTVFRCINSNCYIERDGISMPVNNMNMPFNVLNSLLPQWNNTAFIDYISHFWGGYVGYISYDAVTYIEELSINKRIGINIPDIYLFQTDRMIVIDHEMDLVKIIDIIDPANRREKDYRQLVKGLEALAKKIQLLPRDEANRVILPDKEKEVVFEQAVTKDIFIEMVTDAKDYISTGDIYQVNLARHFKLTLEEDAVDLYKRLSIINPSPFGGILKFGDLFIISSSPERLFRVSGKLAETRPIAGTMPRGDSNAEDNELKRRLISSIKERAEHIMLVDLERNDLGRICNYASVMVDELMALESYSHVWHIVSNIKGILKDNITIKDIICAMFPGGTITGCPKIRSMEIIGELEPVSRGIYTGSMGYIGFDSYADMNIVIRSLIKLKDQLHFHVGAGIVADSIPEKEYMETEQKAGALIQAISTKIKD